MDTIHWIVSSTIVLCVCVIQEFRREGWRETAIIVVVVFPQAPFRVTNVPGQASAGIIQLRNCTMAFLRMAVGDLVTPFVLESCLIIHVLLNLQVHTWGMSLASSGKFV